MWDMYFQFIKDRVCGICTFSSLKAGCVGYVKSIKDMVCGICTFSSLKTGCVGYVFSVH